KVAVLVRARLPRLAGGLYMLPASQKVQSPVLAFPPAPVEPQPDGPEQGSQPRRRRLGLVALTEDLEVPPRDWLVEGLWPQRAVGFIGGPPKAGKSWLALDLAISVATGAPFLGRKVLTTGPVLFFLGEEFLGDVCQRADRLLAGRGLRRPDLGGRLSFTETV